MAEHLEGVRAFLMPHASISYGEFLARKRSLAGDSGFESEPSEQLYPFQRDIVRFASRKGRSAIFADCGLGKTPMQLEWARLVVEQTGGKVLILAPLAVAAQTVREGAKFGIETVQARERGQVAAITVTNYERLDRFADLDWAGVVLDESSILKSFGGRTRETLTRWADRIPFRLCATATPSPNDYEELGGHAEFLGVLNRRQMLAEFFVNDGLSAARRAEVMADPVRAARWRAQKRQWWREHRANHPGTGAGGPVSPAGRTGRRYAAGSHKTWAGWEPRVCCRCGRKVTLQTSAMSNYDHATGTAWTLCGDCLVAGGLSGAGGCIVPAAEAARSRD